MFASLCSHLILPGPGSSCLWLEQVRQLLKLEARYERIRLLQLRRLVTATLACAPPQPLIVVCKIPSRS